MTSFIHLLAGKLLFTSSNQLAMDDNCCCGCNFCFASREAQLIIAGVVNDGCISGGCGDSNAPYLIPLIDAPHSQNQCCSSGSVGSATVICNINRNQREVSVVISPEGDAESPVLKAYLKHAGPPADESIKWAVFGATALAYIETICLGGVVVLPYVQTVGFARVSCFSFNTESSIGGPFQCDGSASTCSVQLM